MNRLAQEREDEIRNLQNGRQGSSEIADLLDEIDALRSDAQVLVDKIDQLSDMNGYLENEMQEMTREIEYWREKHDT